MKISIVFCSLFLTLNVWAHNGDSAGVKTLVTFKLDPKVRDYLIKHDVDILGVNYNINTMDALLTAEQMQGLQQKDIKFLYELPQNLLRGPDPEYQTGAKIEAAIKKFHDKYPELTSLKSIGTSLQGRNIWAIKISDNASVREIDEPVVLFNSMHHAREIMTPEVSLDLIDYLLSNYNSSNEVRHWVESNEIWVIPMFNVDGNNIVWTDDNMWRKNARGDFGVDLNRNYPAGWNSCNGSSGSTWSQTYRGTAPASEPETQAMMKFVAEIKPVFDISYHSYSELVIYPYGCEPQRTPTREVVETIGKEVAQKLNYKPGTAWELLYNADGGDIDWMYQDQQVIPFVIEVNSSSEGFQPDYNEWRDKTVKRNRAGWQHLLTRLDGSGVRGVMKSQDQVVIDVLRNGVSFQKYKINPDGTFHIVLPPGSFELNFTASGRSILNKKVQLTSTRLDLGTL